MNTIREMMFGSSGRVSGEGREGTTSTTSPNSSHGQSAQRAARAHEVGLGISMQGRTKDEHGDDNIIPSTDFAIPYRSTFTDRHRAAHPSAKLGEQFSHLNCSYLSTPHHAPSLTQLKQHARALILVIRDLTISASTGTLGTGSFRDNKTWDFLSDLDAPWVPDTDPALPENRPLRSVLNNLSQPCAQRKEVYPVCPLYTEPDIETRDFVARPLGSAQMESLVRHTAGTLQLLDHALHSNGGLLSALPLDDDKNTRDDGIVGGRGQSARAESKSAHRIALNTFLGQWIHFTRLLVSRTHELGRDLTQALDILAGTATIPKQLHGDLTKTATITSQDRFVMANSGDAVYGNLMRLLDAHPKSVVEEIKTVGREHVVDANGTHIYDHGEPVYRDVKALVATRGLVYVDVVTRFAKLRGGRTVFVTPRPDPRSGFGLAEAEAGGADARPTVVQVAMPGFSSRASEWEERYGGLIQRAYVAEQRKVPVERVLREQVREMRELREVWETNDMLAEKSRLVALVARKDKERDDLLVLLESLKGVVNGYRRGCGEEEMDDEEVDELAARARREAEEEVLRGLRERAEGRSGWVDRVDSWGFGGKDVESPRKTNVKVKTEGGDADIPGLQKETKIKNDAGRWRFGGQEVELPKTKTKVKTDGEKAKTPSSKKTESPKKPKARDLPEVKTAEEDEYARRHRELYDIPELVERPTEDEAEQEHTGDEDDEMPDLEDMEGDPYGFFQVDPNATFDETEHGATNESNEDTSDGIDSSGEDKISTREETTTTDEDGDTEASVFHPSRDSSDDSSSDTDSKDSDAPPTPKNPTTTPSKQNAKPPPPNPILPPGKPWDGIVQKLSPRSTAALTKTLRQSSPPAHPPRAPQPGGNGKEPGKGKKRSARTFEDGGYSHEEEEAEAERGLTDAQKRRRRRRSAKDVGLWDWRDVGAGSESEGEEEEEVEPEEVKRELEVEGLLGGIGGAAEGGRRMRTHSKAKGGKRDRDVGRRREEELQKGLEKEYEELAKWGTGDEDLLDPSEE
jgi:hypothetical protein